MQLRTAKTKTKTGRELDQLRELARLYGVAAHYVDIEGRGKRSTTEGLLAITTALGASVRSMGNIPTALEERRDALRQQTVDPVAVAWDGAPPKIGLRVEAEEANSAVSCHLTLETGEVRSWT